MWWCHLVRSMVAEGSASTNRLLFQITSSLTASRRFDGVRNVDIMGSHAAVYKFDIEPHAHTNLNRVLAQVPFC